MLSRSVMSLDYVNKLWGGGFSIIDNLKFSHWFLAINNASLYSKVYHISGLLKMNLRMFLKFGST